MSLLPWLLGFLYIFGLHGRRNDQEHHPQLNPRQLGTVHFPVACKSSEQTPFEHGLALLHSFWYEEAEKQFLEVASDDPHCAMAHWGVAMSLWHQLWEEPDPTIMRRGLAESQKAAQINRDLQSPGSSLPSRYSKDALARERAYISAITRFYSGSEKLDHKARASAYSAAMKEAYVFPFSGGGHEDYSAVTFLARALGAARSRQLSDARKNVDEVKSIAKMQFDQGRKGEAGFLDRQTAEPLAWIALAEGKYDNAIALLRPVADRETEGMNTTGYLPAHEVLADLLLAAGRPQQALDEYQSDLRLNPNRFNGLAGAAAAAEQAGNQRKAVEYSALLLKVCEGSHSTRPELMRAKMLVAQR